MSVARSAPACPLRDTVDFRLSNRPSMVLSIFSALMSQSKPATQPRSAPPVRKLLARTRSHTVRHSARLLCRSSRSRAESKALRFFDSASTPVHGGTQVSFQIAIAWGSKSRSPRARAGERSEPSFFLSEGEGEGTLAKSCDGNASAMRVPLRSLCVFDHRPSAPRCPASDFLNEFASDFCFSWVKRFWVSPPSAAQKNALTVGAIFCLHVAISTRAIDANCRSSSGNGPVRHWCISMSKYDPCCCAVRCPVSAR